MTNQEIKELLQIFKESDVAEMEVQRGENRLRLRRAGVMHEHTVQEHSASASAPAASVSAPASPAPRGAAPESTHILEKSPIVGTYYDAPAPGSPVFVKVGDAVEPGQVLCIIESMKLMNEIEAEVAGVIAAKLVENGRPVEYGEALFSIRPR
jgi:acetyl-CoA carboxylase biotin carboxyl carrier protein